MSGGAKAVAWCAVFACAFAVALTLDVPIEHRIFVSGFAAHLQRHEAWLLWLARRPGNILTFTLPAAVLLAMDPARRRAAAIVLLSGIYSGANWIIKWLVGRTRPYHDPATGPFGLHPMEHGIFGLFHATRPYGFPSGDVCLAAATAMSLCWVLPRWRLFWWGLVILVAVERMAEMAHFPSDIVAGAATGVLAALAARATIDHIAPQASVIERNASPAVSIKE